MLISFQRDWCCVGGSFKDNELCTSYLGVPCGGIQGYAEMGSTCCMDRNGRLAVLYCDNQISLTWRDCLSPYSCVTRTGITSGKKRGLESYNYSQCEKIGD
jgi:hypothetical protein